MLPNTYPQGLLPLGGLSPQSPDQLRDVLDGGEFDERISDLQIDGLLEVINYLEKVLDGLDPAGAAFRHILQKLQEICISRKCIPSSHVLTADLLDISKDNFASGGFSDVFHGTYDGHEVCVKRLRLSSTGSREKMLHREALIWKRLIHINIVPFIGVTYDPLQIVSEWMSGGNLTAHIESNPRANRIILLIDVAKGLKYLHQSDVVHGDLKGPNIMVDAHGCARITDFGLARNQDAAGETHVVAGGTARWTAPEILKDQGTLSKGADVFSFAMVMVEVFTGSAPFNLYPSIAATLAIMRGERPPRPVHPGFTDGLWELMQCCWSQESNLRPDTTEILQVLESLNAPGGDASGSGSRESSAHELVEIGVATSSRIVMPAEIQVLQKLPPISLEDLASLVAQSRFIPFIVSTTLRAERSPSGSPPLSPAEAKSLVEILDTAISSNTLDRTIKNECLEALRKFSPAHGVLPGSRFLSGVTLNSTIPYASGGSADVWKGQHNGKQVCIKAFRIRTAANPEKIKRGFYREVTRWTHISHPNVLPFLGVSETLFPFCIITPWLPNGNVTRYIQKHPEANRLQLLAQATCGLEYLHSENIVHSNINPGNILITEEGNACLGDFGITAIITDRTVMELQSMTTSKPGVARYMAPELLNPPQFGSAHGGYSKESDVYSFAMASYEILSGVLPYGLGRESATAFVIVSGGRPPRPYNQAADRWLPDSIWDAIQRCWTQAPESRPAIDQLHRAFIESELKQKGDTSVTEDGKDTATIDTDVPSPVLPPVEEKSPVQSARPSVKSPSRHSKSPVQSPSVKRDWYRRVLARPRLFCCCR